MTLKPTLTSHRPATRAAGRAASRRGICCSVWTTCGLEINMNTPLLLIVSIAWAVCAGRPFAQAAAAGTDTLPLPVLSQVYDPAGLVRFATKEQAEAKRQELIHFIWPQGLPTNTLPKVVKNVGAAVFAGDLSGLDAALAAAVDRLDADVAPYDFHGIGYLVHPSAQTANNRRLVIVNSGHRAGVAFSYGVNDAANRLLSEGFCVLMTDMPLVGFNTDNTIALPDRKGSVTITKRGSAGHNEIFATLVPGALPGGVAFRLFLEPMVQGLNYFLSVTPDAVDVSYVGLSGGGWTGHMLAALDTRIKQSFPVAGAMPLYARELSRGSWGDTEQFYAPLYGETDTNGDGITDTASGVASWLEIFALGGFGAGRRQIQVLNYYDSCCFHGSAFLTYTDFVTSVVRELGLGEWSFYSDTTHCDHRISSDVLNRVIVPALIGKAPATRHSG